MSDAEKPAVAARTASRPTGGGRGGATAAGARIGAARAAPAAASSSAGGGGGEKDDAGAGGRQRPTKASAALQRKQQLGKAPVGGGRQQQMATGFETVRLPSASLQRLGDGVVQAQGEKHAELSEIFAVMKAARVTGEELWQGAPVVRPLIKHFARDLRAFAPPPDAATLVSFVFPPTDEFQALGLVAPRAYRVERLMPIGVLVQRVLSRLGVEGTDRFTLATLGGFVLHEQHRLADYGLGSLLPNWELTFVDKAMAAAAAEAERAQAEAGAGSTTLGGGEAAARVSLLIVFEEADQGGWKQRLQRLAIAPDVQIEAVLRALIERQGAPWSLEQLTLRTFDDDPIDPSATLENYGLGHVMTRWAVKLQVDPSAIEAQRARLAQQEQEAANANAHAAAYVPATPVTEVAETSTATATASTPSATQVPQGSATPELALTSLPPPLNPEVATSPRLGEELVTALKLRNEELTEELSRVQALEAEQRETHAKVMGRAQKLREHLEQERIALRTQVEQSQQKVEEAEAKARYEQAERARSEERLQHRVDSLEAQLTKERANSSANANANVNASEEQQLLEASLSNLTSVVENLEIELQHANTRLAENKAEADASADRAKERMGQQQSELERLNQELVRAQGATEREAKARADAERRAAELEAKVAALEQGRSGLEETVARLQTASHAVAATPAHETLSAAAPEPKVAPTPTPVQAPTPAPAPVATPAPSAAPAVKAAAKGGEEEVLRQWVHEIVDKSSEAADPDSGYDDWAATQLIGPPKIAAYGDSGNAWAPLETNGGHEWVTVRFRRKVLVHEILILESWNPGAITKVELKRPDGIFEEVFSQPAEAAEPELRIMRVAPEKAPKYATDTVKLHLDTTAIGDNEWNEIAAVQLAGVPTEPESAADIAKNKAAGPPPPPPPPMTLPTPPPMPKGKLGASVTASATTKKAGSAQPSSGDLMTDLLSVVQQGKGGLRSAKDSRPPAQKPKVEEPSDTIAAVLLKRFNAMHGAGKYEDLSGGDDWADEAAKAGEAEWGDEDAW